jgi:hypothetical protein
MSTVTLNKQVVEPTWNTTKIQEEAVRMHSMLFLTAMNNIAKLGGEKAVQEFQAEMRQHKVEHYKKVGVKTPLELVKAMAEFEANVFGSKIEITGDDTKAELKYNQCARWNAMKQHGHFSPEQEEQMGKGFEMCVSNLAKEFGFKAETKMEGETCVLHFSK